MEREIQAELRQRPPQQETRSTLLDPPTLGSPMMAMPDYVEHRDGATEIGKLSAEAVVREYEATAKEIESMGSEILDRVKQCEAMTRDALAVTDELKEVAARYREEAKRVFEQIESCSLVVAEARKTCSDLKDKISVAMPADRLKPKKK
jgi:phosphoglycolate phosphatase-like HAD superfamily hydrolase